MADPPDDEGSLDPELVDLIKKDDRKALLEKITDRQQSSQTINRNQILIEACKNGASEISIHLIENKECSVESKDSSGNSLLHLASQSDSISLVEQLVLKMKENGMNCVALLNSKKETALHIACSSGKLNNVIYLIEKALFDPSQHNEEGMTILHISCKIGKLDIVKYLISQVKMDPSMEAQDEQGVGTHPIHFAAMYGHSKVVIFLINECGCDPHALDNKGRSVVYLAADGGSLHLMRYLIEDCHCDPNHRTKPFKQAAAGRSPLHSASFQGHLEIIRYLVMQCECDPSVQDEANVVPLACAAQEGKMETVRFFAIECKVKVDCQDSTGRTPLHYACLKGHIKVVELLIKEAKANINTLDNNGETAVIVAAKGKHLEVFSYLVRLEECNLLNDSSQSGRSVLHFAAAYNWLTEVQYLVTAKHMNPEDFDSTGMSALHHAADSGSLSVVKFFIEESKCDTNLLSKEGDTRNTPLLKACARGHLEVVKYLIVERGCSIKPSEGRVMHPIHLACTGGHIQLVEFLLTEGGQSIDSIDKQGALPVHFSVLNGHLELTKILVKKFGADPMKKTRKGATAVHAACQGGHLELLRYLISERRCHLLGSLDSGGSPLHRAAEHGHLDLVKFLIEELVCAPNHRDANGRVALHYSALKGLVEMCEYFLDLSCDVMVRDSAGVIPLHLACSSGHQPIIELLLKFDASSQVVCKDTKGNTPLQLAKQSSKITKEMLMLFLKNGADASDLMEVAPASCLYLKSHQRLYSPIKIFLLGEPKELIQELQRTKSVQFPPSSIRHPAFPQASLVKSNNFDALFYEIPTALSCCSGLIADTLAECQHPVIVICLDSYKEKEKIFSDANRWLTAITYTMKNNAHCSSSCKPLLLFEVDDCEKSYMKSVNEEFLSWKMPTYQTLTANQVVYSLRRTGEPYGAVRLLGKIGTYANTLQGMGYLPALASAMKAFLSSDLMNSELFCTLQELSDRITDNDSLLPTSLEEIADILDVLCKNASIIFIRNPDNISLSWLILDIELVNNLILGDLVEIKFSNPLGLIKQSELIRHCTIEPSLFLPLIKYSGVCVDITEISQLSNLATAANVITAKEDHVYCFPHVLPASPPNGLMLQTKSNQISLGWITQCVPPSSHFSPSFCSLLPIVLPLFVDYSLTERISSNRSFAIWERGVHWVVDGIKIAIVNYDNDTILIIVKGKKGKSLPITEKRNDVVRSLRMLLKTCCKEVSTEEYLVHPECLKTIHFDKEELPPLSVIPLVEIENDYKQAERLLSCPYEQFVGFEPYHIIKRYCPNTFFNEQECNRTLSTDVIAKLADGFSPFHGDLHKILLDGHTATLEEQLQAPPTSADAAAPLVLRILMEWVERNGSQATYSNLWGILQTFSLY